MANKILQIYHKEDNDGLFSAAIMFDYLTKKLGYAKQDIELMGASYDDLNKFSVKNTPKSLHKEYEKIIMTDISFNDWKIMSGLWKEFGSNFIWCDHHAPIIKMSDVHGFNDIPGVRSTDRSAILCVWKYLYDTFDEEFPDGDIPALFKVLSAFDSWTHKERGYDAEYVHAINHGCLAKTRLNFDKTLEIVQPITDAYRQEKDAVVKMLCDNYISQFLEKGKMLDEADDNRYEDLINTNGDFEWTIKDDDGKERKAVALFMQGATGSGVFKSVADKAPHGIVFKRNPSGTWTISLYNTKDTETFHCGEFLKERYGGGGHKGAAGCQVPQEKFVEILSAKQL